MAARNPAGRCDGDRPGRVAATDLDPTTPSRRPRSHRHQRRRRHRPRPALGRQHRPRQRLTGTETPTAGTTRTFGMTPLRDAVAPPAVAAVPETSATGAGAVRPGSCTDTR